MATSKLVIFNDALRLCRERKLSTLTDNRESRRLLDAAWGDGSTYGSVRRCLEAGQWTFAIRSVQADYSPSVTPAFGYTYAFDQPIDMVRVAGLYQDEHCTVPLTRYSDERRYWYCDLQTIYASYVSNHATYGGAVSLWSEMFAKFVAADLAHEIVGNLTQDKSVRDDVLKEWQFWKKEAAGTDGMNRPTRRLPEGSWTASRRGGNARQSRWSGEMI